MFIYGAKRYSKESFNDLTVKNVFDIIIQNTKKQIIYSHGVQYK